MITLNITHLNSINFEEESSKYGLSNIFMDKDFNILSIINENDANWRHEYFDSIFNKIGVTIELIQPEEIENLSQKLADYYGF